MLPMQRDNDMSDQIKNHCKALQAYATGIFRMTLHIICGECQRSFSTREYTHITNMGNEIAGCCPHCGYWNRTGLVED